jgi:hypothetical protein
MTVRAIFRRLIAQTITKPTLHALARGTAARRRWLRGLRPTMLYFHQVDDPYSHLAVQMLPALLARYDVDVRPYLLPPPSPAAAPEAARQASYARKDASLVASMHGLAFEAACVPIAPGIGAVAGHLALRDAEAKRRLWVGVHGFQCAVWRSPPQPSPAWGAHRHRGLS